MHKILRTGLGTAAALVPILMVACATPTPSKELVEARSAYDEVSKSNAQQLVPDRVLSAKQALDRAEAAFEEDPGSFEEQSLAYLAHREALLAMTLAGQSAATKDVEDAETEYKELQEEYRKLTKKELADREAKLEKAQSELEKERQARKEAEKKLLAAMKSLEEIAKVKEESRGMVITLSGAVLFASGKSDLLPIAMEKLDKVAEVLQEQDPNKKFVVEGHTDSVGSEENNRRLSQDRADTVRNYLVSRGVPAAQISAIGKGESTPVATNTTPDGRANNRRVEIVVN